MYDQIDHLAHITKKMFHLIVLRLLRVHVAYLSARFATCTHVHVVKEGTHSRRMSFGHMCVMSQFNRRKTSIVSAF